MREVKRTSSGGLNRNSKRKVFNKGKMILFKNPFEWRKDANGNVIRFSDYGKRNSKHGWEGDHDYPKSKGGTDALSNIRPLAWFDNKHKGNKIRRGSKKG